MASLTQWTWVWANLGRWWRTGKPGVLQSMGSQRVGHNRATEQKTNAMIVSLSRTLWGLPGTVRLPIVSTVAPLWSAQIIVSHVYFLSFTDAKKPPPNGRTYLLDHEHVACTWTLRTDHVNFYDTSLLPHHQLVTELCRSWSHTLCPFSLTLPLKRFCWNPSEILGFFEQEPLIPLARPYNELFSAPNSYSSVSFGLTVRQAHKLAFSNIWNIKWTCMSILGILLLNSKFYFPPSIFPRILDLREK